MIFMIVRWEMQSKYRKIYLLLIKGYGGNGLTKVAIHDTAFNRYSQKEVKSHFLQES